MIQVGDKYEVYYGPKNPNNIKKLHVLAVVDEDVIVYKLWNKYRKRWIYKVDAIGYLDYLLELGDMFPKV